jgi:hypothetical protein
MAEKSETRTVRWTRTAEIQFFEILRYWTNRNSSTSYAEKLSLAVWERTEFILHNPLASIQTDLPNTRRAAMGHYSLLYQIDEMGILITAFWDNRQDPKKLLMALGLKKVRG